jgi:hypothetical protein
MRHQLEQLRGRRRSLESLSRRCCTGCAMAGMRNAIERTLVGVDFLVLAPLEYR